MPDYYSTYRERLPGSYVHFFEAHGGWAGDLGDDCRYVVLWDREELQERWVGYEMNTYLDPSWFVFGTDGGGEMLCFNLQAGFDTVFMLPFLGMSDEQPLELCPSFSIIAARILGRERGQSLDQTTG